MQTSSSLVTLPRSVLTKTAHPKMSERYVHIDSEQVIELMAREGFHVATVTKPKTRVGDPMYARHQIDFRREDWKNEGDIRGGYVPRMLYTNSHDGTTRASFMLGVYAFVCSNGMVVGSTYASESVRHAGESAADLISRMQALAKNTGPMFAQIGQWQRKQLTTPQAREFGRLASVLRWGDDQRFAVEDVLHVRRADDDRGDLWTTFNRVQENTVRGGIVGLASTGRRATSRPMSEILATTKYNRDLWRLAEDFATV